MVAIPRMIVMWRSHDGREGQDDEREGVEGDIQAAATVARDETGGAAEDQSDDHTGKPDDQGDPGTEDQAGQQIAAEVVGPYQMGAAGRLVEGGVVLEVGILEG
jgi:hypothetical protein